MSSEKMYLEDFYVGQKIELGSFSFSEEEILEFANRFDPQPFHVQPEAARESVFGGLIASGWHTCSQMMRLMCDNLLARVDSMGSPGCDELRWLKPVRPGDQIRTEMVVTAVRASASKPDRGFMSSDWNAWNQHGEKVVSIKAVGMYGCRPKSDKQA
ncbi:MaoC family dehydratase [Lacisediminimonas profundi]|uniref:MaoC family dehydratase n=1 Tax=Lacisediminimonas profundi TaxID=2603856 RepID=UPI00124B6E0C|nr:MaoC family dehydratase [Lacisediminimonas profundi]